MKEKPMGETINIQIMENEKSVNDWELNSLAWELYWWVDLFNIAFFKERPVPVPAISFERTNVNNLGHYVVGRNAFGVRENININRVHLNRPMWDILATLLHEMAHSWQYIHGHPSKSWFHNKEFQLKLLSFGILINKNGCHIGAGDPFIYLIRRHGIEFGRSSFSGGMVTLPPKGKVKGKSKLKKWTCGCTNIRVAIRDLEAECLKCGNRFVLVE